MYDLFTVGTTDCASTGSVHILGGCLAVTNASGTAVLELRSGSFSLEGGLVVVDNLIATNSCTQLRITGGNVRAGNCLLSVIQDADADGLANGWEQTHALDPLTAVGINGPSGDPDGDGLTNLEEQQADTNPRDATSGFGVVGTQTEGADFRITWTAVGGKSYVVQTNATPAGSGFRDCCAAIYVPGSGETTTNYLDIGGATNTPARFYRIRLAP